MPNLDRAVNKAYISFDEKGHMLLSTETEEYGRLGIGPSARLTFDLMAQGSMANLYEVFKRVDGLRGAQW